MSCNIFPPTAGTHDITTPMEITSQRTTDGLPYFPFSVWVCTHRIWKVQRVWHSGCVQVSRMGLSLPEQHSQAHAELSTRAISLVHHAQGGLHVLLETFIRPFVGEVQCVVLWGRRGGQCASQTRLRVCEGISLLTPKTARETGGSCSKVRTKTIRFNIVFQKRGVDF